jgi:NifU-like protein
MAWEYSDKTKQLFMNAVQGKPGTHLGEIENPDGLGEHGSIVCGDALRFSFRVRRAPNPVDDVIVEARYLTFGCTSAIAASEALCALVESKSLTPIQALSITNQDIVDFLGGLPQQKIHCSVMGAEALEAAVVDWAARRGVDLAAQGVRLSGEKADDDGRVVCKCFGITEPYLLRKIRELKLKTVEDVTSALKAGGMCGACRYAPGGIQDLLNQVWGTACASCALSSPDAAPAAPPASPEPSPYILSKRIENALGTTVRPMLRADGGDLELVDIKGHKVFVALQGACATCPGASRTLQLVVENSLRDAVDSRIEVIPV